MPARRTLADEVSRAAGKCLRLRCEEHFPTSPISALSQIVSGGTPDTGEARYWDGDVVWLTPKDLGRPRPVVVAESERTLARAALSEGKARIVPKGTVLLSSRAPIGHLAIAGKDLATNQGFKNIICSDQLHNRFLFHVLRGSIAELEALGRGNTFLEIPAKVVKDFRIPVPPLALQIEAANLLDAIYVRMTGRDIALPPVSEPLSGLIGTLERIEAIAGRIEEAKLLRGEVEREMEAILSAGVDAIVGSDFAERPLESICDIGRPITYGIVQAGEHVPDGVPYIRVSDMATDQLSPIGMLRTSHAIAARYQRSEVRTGDIVFAIRATIGKMRIVPQSLDGANLTQGTARIAAGPEAITEYLYWVLQSRRVWNRIQAASKGSTFREITLGRLRAIEVPVPSLPDQRKVIAKCRSLADRLGALRMNQSESTLSIDALSPAVLDRAFRGEL